MKTRCFPAQNYKAFFIDGTTLRIKLDPSKPITDLPHPEFMDIKITNYCEGKCPYCYQDSGKEDNGYNSAQRKLEWYFGNMSRNQRPFQVALGGGNPNQHKDFYDILWTLHRLGITPNYTTNGMGLTEEALWATEECCGGVAISTHPQLRYYWEKAIDLLHPIVQTNLHIIISDRDSIDRFYTIRQQYKDRIKYFVLLPYCAVGRATPKDIDYDYLTETLEAIGSTEDIAFGANFYSYLRFSDFKGSLYEPEIFSKYLDVKDMKLYKSSFNLQEVR